MLKYSAIAVVFFILGLLTSGIFLSDQSNTGNNLSASMPKTDINTDAQTKQKTIPSNGQEPAASVIATPKKIDFAEPKTPFGYYQAFASLDNFSADEIADYLLAIDPFKTELRNQIAWFLSGKFPEKAFEILDSNALKNDKELSKALIFNLSSNHPDITQDWIINNDGVIDSLFANEREKRTLKLINLNSLARIPEYKWEAYEQGMALINNGSLPNDKYSKFSLAQNAASSDPLEAVNYALSKTNGSIDAHLLNGALTEYAKKSPNEASRYILENEAAIDSMAISSTMSSFLFKDKFDDAYSFINSLETESLKENAIGQLSSDLTTYGKNEQNGLKFVQSLKDEKSKISAAGSLTNSMSVTGYSVEKQMEILDKGLSEVSPDAKSFQYAWTLKRGYGKDSPETKQYINQLERSNPELAKAVKQSLQYL
jgi:hypothetical protein